MIWCPRLVSHIMKALLLTFALLGLLIAGCGPAVPADAEIPVTPAVAPLAASVEFTPVPSATATSTVVPAIPATVTPIPTASATPSPIPTATPTATETPIPSPTAEPLRPCDQRIPDDGLLPIITQKFAMSRDFAPSDLVKLSDALPNRVTLGYPSEIREMVLPPLAEMIAAMESAGLKPFIISAYRSYAAQSIAWNKWLQREPDRAAILSAPPGHSEHQLGTTVDFGSPELPGIVGEEDIQFHTYFYMTSESRWLEENAHLYGFTLSYPRDSFELTGFYYEPWHYRYVGVDLATQLKDTGQFLTANQFETQPPPCIP